MDYLTVISTLNFLIVLTLMLILLKIFYLIKGLSTDPLTSMFNYTSEGTYPPISTGTFKKEVVV